MITAALLKEYRGLVDCATGRDAGDEAEEVWSRIKAHWHVNLNIWQSTSPEDLKQLQEERQSVLKDTLSLPRQWRHRQSSRLRPVVPSTASVDPGELATKAG